MCMPIFPSSWPTAAHDIAQAARENQVRASTTVRLTPAQRRQEVYTQLVNAIEEGDVSSVQSVLANNPSVSLDEPGWERVETAIFENFSTEIMDCLVAKNFRINPRMYMTGLTENFLPAMYAHFCTSVADIQTRNYCAHEFFNQALKNMLHDSNKVRASSRQLRTQLLKDFTHLTTDMAQPYYSTRMWHVDLLGKLPLFYPENFHPDDQYFIENLADPIKQMCLRGISARAEDVTIQQLHSITRFFENQPSYAAAFNIQDQKSAQEKRDNLNLWRSLIPVGAHTWNQTTLAVYLKTMQQQWPEDEVRVSTTHYQFAVSEDMTADFSRSEIFLTTPDLDQKLGFDIYDRLYRFYPYLNVVVMGETSEKPGGILVKHQNARGADDFLTTMIVSGAPAATALMKLPNMTQRVNDILSNKLHLMKWVTKAPIAAVQLLCKEHPHWKTWTDESGNNLAHYLCALRPASQLNEKVIGHLTRINSNWLIEPNNNGVTLSEIVRQNHKSASLKSWMEQQTLNAQIKSDATTRKKMNGRSGTRRKM